MKKRSEADSKYTWKLEDMVAEDSQWEQMFKEAAGEISEYASYKGRLAGSADTLPRISHAKRKHSRIMKIAIELP